MEQISHEKNFYIINTEKYKRSQVNVEFLLDYKAVDYNALKLLIALLTNANAEYNSIALMSKKQAELYDSNVSAKVALSGETLIVSMTVSFLSEKYTEAGNTASAIKLLADMIYKPFIKNGKFNASYFKLIKDRAVNAMVEGLQRKEVLAISEYAKLFAGTPFLADAVADVKALKKVSQEDVMKAYETLLQAENDFIIAGDNDDEAIKEEISKCFKMNPSSKHKLSYKIDKEIAPVVKKDKRFAQSFLIMLYKNGIVKDDEDYERLVLLSSYLNNKLFKSVREKYGLCYMIHSRILPANGATEVLMGIEAKNYRKAMRIVNKEIDKIKEGKVVKKEFVQAKESLLGSIVAMEDSLATQVSRLESCLLSGKYKSAKDFIDKISTYGIEDVVKVCKKIEPLTTYFLKGVGSNE